MNNKILKTFPLFIAFLFLMTACTQQGKKVKIFKHDTPLIKTDVKKLGKKER